MHWGMSTPAALEAVRRHAPLVSCITNAVVTNITANVLLALGAAPAMVDITGEAGPFARVGCRSHGCVVAVSGPVDLVTDGESVIHVQGGSALLTRITGGGCALGAVVAAFLGAGRKEGLDDVSAVVAAHTVYSAAAERAEARSTGPGSFSPAFLDVLYALEMQDLQNVSVSATSATTAAEGGPA